MDKIPLKTFRKEMFDEMEQHWLETNTPEDDIFHYHSSEDRIVLSHALFWIMTQSVRGKIAKEKFFLLLRRYQEEMLEAYLTESADFPELLRYCNIIYNMLPIILMGAFRTDKAAHKLAATCVVASGYGGDMPEELCDELLDDIDFHYNKVKCRKIEQMLPSLNKMVEDELQAMPF